MNPQYDSNKILKLIIAKLSHNFGISPQDASDSNIYQALALVMRDIIHEQRREFREEIKQKEGKTINYLCMEFLMGRSLKNSLYNLGIEKEVEEALSTLGVKLEKLYDQEPDAGLGNGGLGRLAACFLDSLASQGYAARGYSLLYEYGIFRQKIVDGWQTEMPDAWLPGGDVWLIKRPESTKEIRFDGYIEDSWDGQYHRVEHRDCSIVEAVPYDMYVPGKDGKGVAVLRLWSAQAHNIDMNLFNQGDYMRAVEQNSMAEVITKVLYPSDNHREGKSLRLKQQYFLTSASIQDIVTSHLAQYGTLSNFPEKNAIHINDTHPALAIPELMRIMLDECGLTWDEAWDIVTRSVAYTNHTVMSEALEVWPEDLFKSLLPRIYQIVLEINKRACAKMAVLTNHNLEKVSNMAVVSYGMVKMANLSIIGSHKVNGVSQLHSDILKESTFSDFYSIYPEKFTNVTNGIAHRRWLCQANPKLTNFLTELIGPDFATDGSQLEKLKQYSNDPAVLDELQKIKRYNKERISKYVEKSNGIKLDPDSIFDVQVKRLHEYKRQHLNALHIISLYQQLKENPNLDIVPQTYIFGAKAAPGYYMAKQIIRLLCKISQEIENDPVIRQKLRVVYLEDYRVSLAELLIPSADISEQISLAGTEASGTGNMKLMINGAVTLGTLDGANVEIHQAVGDDNIVLFGMTTPEVERLKRDGYNPQVYYNNNLQLKAAVDSLNSGYCGVTFNDIYNSLVYNDPYMVMADFEDYCRAHRYINEIYQDKAKFNEMSLQNIANAGIFASDRSIRDYANGIWNLDPIR